MQSVVNLGLVQHVSLKGGAWIEEDIRGRMAFVPH